MADRDKFPLPYESARDSRRRKRQFIRLDTIWGKIGFAILILVVLFTLGLPVWLLAPHRTSYQTVGYITIEETPRPMLSPEAWGKLQRGMSEKQVRMLLGEPDWTMGPYTLEFKSGTVTITDTRTGEMTTQPSPATTYTTATATWEYKRPTSEAPQVVYTVKFDQGVVTSFWMNGPPAAPSTSYSAP